MWPQFGHFRILILYLYFILLVPLVYSQLYSSPCPEMLEYKVNENGEFYASLKVSTWNKTMTLSLKVTVVVANEVQDYYGRVILTHPKRKIFNDMLYRRPMQYEVYFPEWENIPPRVTNITVNDRVVCLGPRPESYSILVVFSLTHTLKVSREKKMPIHDFPNVPTTLRKYSNICGVSLVPTPLIVNGYSVEHGAFPWLAAIFIEINSKLRYRCTGSLISVKHVVTAAHCIKKNKKYYFVMGKLNIMKSATVGKIIQAADIQIHPDYNPETYHSDIAVAVLREEVVFTNFIRPICLWSESDDINEILWQKGKVVGWGKDENNLITEESKQVTIPVVSHEQCKQSHPIFKDYVTPKSFCSGDRNNSGPCMGDSGSGFIMYRNNRWVLRGVVSLSLTALDNTNSCDLSNYIVLTDVTKYRPWLTNFFK